MLTFNQTISIIFPLVFIISYFISFRNESISSKIIVVRLTLLVNLIVFWIEVNYYFDELIMRYLFAATIEESLKITLYIVIMKTQKISSSDDNNNSKYSSILIAAAFGLFENVLYIHLGFSYIRILPVLLHLFLGFLAYFIWNYSEKRYLGNLIVLHFLYNYLIYLHALNEFKSS